MFSRIEFWISNIILLLALGLTFVDGSEERVEHNLMLGDLLDRVNIFRCVNRIRCKAVVKVKNTISKQHSTVVLGPSSVNYHTIELVKIRKVTIEAENMWSC